MLGSALAGFRVASGAHTRQLRDAIEVRVVQSARVPDERKKRVVLTEHKTCFPEARNLMLTMVANGRASIKLIQTIDTGSRLVFVADLQRLDPGAEVSLGSHAFLLKTAYIVAKAGEGVFLGV